MVKKNNILALPMLIILEYFPSEKFIIGKTNDCNSLLAVLNLTDKTDSNIPK
jgi:hypothetical protein